MFTLDQIVPWGRSFEEYERMFALGGADLASRMLGCADGPASFNAEATRRGLRVVSCDPLYHWDAGPIRDRIEATFDIVVEQTRRNAGEFVWDTAIASVDDLSRVRMDAMEVFLADYESGRRQGRYIDAELPALPFADQQFDLALSSHFLFLYTQQLTADFHIAGARELCRVAREVRIFPLLALGGERSAHVDPVMEAMRRDGRDASVVTVPYEFQRGGNQMLRVVIP
jgi:hypothetical protein